MPPGLILLDFNLGCGNVLVPWNRVQVQIPEILWLPYLILLPFSRFVEVVVAGETTLRLLQEGAGWGCCDRLGPR